MDKFAEVSAKTKENLMEIFKEFYMEIYHKNKKKFMEKKNKSHKKRKSQMIPNSIFNINSS